jgi:hypothetical protein
MEEISLEFIIWRQLSLTISYRYLATITHLANHITTSLNKIQLSRDGAHDDVGSQLDDTPSQEAPDWNFYDGDTGNTTHQYGENDLVDQLFNVEGDVFGSSLNPNRRRVS